MNLKKEVIQRELYLKRVRPFYRQNLIKVFVGQRRAGKSYLLYQVISELRMFEPDANIVHINMELKEHSKLTDNDELYTYIKSRTINGKITYLLIDEIQLVDKFELTIKSLVAEGGFDIYCTGSNSDLLSGELATLLSGRYIQINMYSLIYSEFLIFHKLNDTHESLMHYLKYGGLPYLKNLPFNDDIIFEYLVNIQDAILYKDVVSRYNIRNVDFLNRLVEYLAQHTGTLISGANISKYLKSQKVNISTNIVLNYIHHLSVANLLFKAKRTDIQGKKIFELGEKYYFSDLGLRNTVTGFNQFDLGLIIENCVFLQLKALGYKVLVGKDGDKEIDFIAEKAGEKRYIQVALRIEKRKTMEREFNNLLAVKNNYPKYVITLDEYTGTSFQGIEHLPLRTFLMKNDF